MKQSTDETTSDNSTQDYSITEIGTLDSQNITHSTSQRTTYETQHKTMQHLVSVLLVRTYVQWKQLELEQWLSHQTYELNFESNSETKLNLNETQVVNESMKFMMK